MSKKNQASNKVSKKNQYQNSPSDCHNNQTSNSTGMVRNKKDASNCKNQNSYSSDDCMKY
ncbi:MAG: hypothetical protein ACOX60_12410 [Massiliimalia sp.]